MPRHIMLDLECLDTTSNATILSIGAVEFDPYSNRMGESFYVEIHDVDQQVKRGHTISYKTVAWWMEQGALAKQLFTPSTVTDPRNRRMTGDALLDFTDFVGRNSDGTGSTLVWGNGADFDNIILGTLYQTYGLQKPWYSYSNNRCFRTMKNLRPKGFHPPNFVGVEHNALDDALYQARYLQELFACPNFPFRGESK